VSWLWGREEEERRGTEKVFETVERVVDYCGYFNL